MANPIKGEVPLKLADGRELVLVMDMEALVEAEAAYGKPLPETMADAGRGFVGASRALLYGALRAKHPMVTLREAGAIFLTDGEAVGEAINQSAEASFPSSVEGRKGTNPPGKTSGGNGARRASSQKASGG